MSDHDRALEKAAEPIKDLPQDVRLNQLDHLDLTRAIVMEWLDSLLEGLPEEAVDAMPSALSGREESVYFNRMAVAAFLRSLRTGLGDGQ